MCLEYYRVILILKLILLWLQPKKEFAALALELMPKDDPATFNQAYEFGAQCPKSPDCTVCVFNTSCAALQKKRISYQV
jgi:adenine-specific DNA glycosylase